MTRLDKRHERLKSDRRLFAWSCHFAALLIWSVSFQYCIFHGSWLGPYLKHPVCVLRTTTPWISRCQRLTQSQLA